MFHTTKDLSIKSAAVPSLAQTREYVNQGGLSRAAVFNQLDGCLSRLATDYVDLLQIHAYDRSTPIEETMRALHDLVVAGKVRYLGACNLKAWQLGEMNSVAERNGWTPFVSVQVEHSLLYRPEVRCLPSVEVALFSQSTGSRNVRVLSVQGRRRDNVLAPSRRQPGSPTRDEDGA